MAITLLDLAKLCDGDSKALARQLITWGLIPDEGTYMCPDCVSNPMKLIANVHGADGLRWHCGKRRNRSKKKPTRCNNSVQLNISKSSAIDWARFCREMIFDAFIEHKEKLGGFGKVVEIDESKFGKGQYYYGHPVEGQWVFGGYERGTGKVFMIPVEDCSADRLLPIIRDWIEEGTTIISDYWRSYDCLSLQGYEHLRVNHSLNFKDPDAGAHTNATETSWRAPKSTINSCGQKKVHIPCNLAQDFFHKRCTELKLDRTVEFLRLAGLLYNPLTPREFPRYEHFTDESEND